MYSNALKFGECNPFWFLENQSLLTDSALLLIVFTDCVVSVYIPFHCKTKFYWQGFQHEQ